MGLAAGTVLWRDDACYSGCVSIGLSLDLHGTLTTWDIGGASVGLVNCAGYAGGVTASPVSRRYNFVALSGVPSSRC